MRIRFALFLSALLAAFALSATSAMALPGDPAISSTSPFRLATGPVGPAPGFVSYLEPGARMLSATDAITGSVIGRELRITVAPGAAVDVDQVLIPRQNALGADVGGYLVVNSFYVDGTPGHESITPDNTGVNMFFTVDGINRPIDLDDVIVVTSRHESSIQNEPYQKEANEFVSAKNRPIVAPKVTAIGASAVSNLRAYKVGFGYDTPKWYSEPPFDGHLALPFVTDPNAFFPTPDGLFNLVQMNNRADDFAYDARRVNDVDGASEVWYGPDYDGDADFYGRDQWFRRGGDEHDAIAGDPLGGTPFNLIATLTQGDLPLEWTLRPSLASADSLRSVTFTDDMLRAWDRDWQLYYAGEGPKPSMPLVPGTNSPDPDRSYGPTVNPQQAMTPAGVVVNLTAPAAQQTGAAAAPAAAVAVKGAPATAKAALRSAKIVRFAGKRYVRVFVRSEKAAARIQIRMYTAKGQKVRQVTKTVKTNRAVRVAGVIVSSKVKTIKVAIVS